VSVNFDSIPTSSWLETSFSKTFVSPNLVFFLLAFGMTMCQEDESTRKGVMASSAMASGWPWGAVVYFLRNVVCLFFKNYSDVPYWCLLKVATAY
jgi:hypothetical protein